MFLYYLICCVLQFAYFFCLCTLQTPQSLYIKYAETNLETIFIKICTEKTLTQESVKRAQTYQKNIANFLTYDSPSPSSTQDTVDLVAATVEEKHGIEETSFTLKNDIRSLQHQHHLAASNSYSIIWLLFILVRRNLQKVILLVKERQVELKK